MRDSLAWYVALVPSLLTIAHPTLRSALMCDFAFKLVDSAASDNPLDIFPASFKSIFRSSIKLTILACAPTLTYIIARWVSLQSHIECQGARSGPSNFFATSLIYHSLVKFPSLPYAYLDHQLAFGARSVRLATPLNPDHFCSGHGADFTLKPSGHTRLARYNSTVTL